MLKNSKFKQMQKDARTHKRDIIVLGSFICAISMLLIVASYVIYRISSEKSYKAKWQDYNECGVV